MVFIMDNKQLEFLEKINAIVRKHGGRMAVAVESNFEDSLNAGIMRSAGFTFAECDEIESFLARDIHTKTSKITYELITAEGEQKVLQLHKSYVTFFYNEQDLQRLKPETVEKVRKIDYGHIGFFNVNYCPTKIIGFNHAEESYLCFLPIDALKFFAQFVCELYKEPILKYKY